MTLSLLTVEKPDASGRVFTPRIELSSRLA
jgi:hypothetical protein